MKILIVTPLGPYSSFSGNGVRVRGFYEVLQAEHDVYVLFAGFRVSQPFTADVQQLGDKLLVESRWAFWVRKVKGLLYRKLGGYEKRELSAKKIRVDDLCPFGLPSRVRALQKEMQFDVIMSVYGFTSKVLEDLPDSVVKLIDAQDLYGDRDKMMPPGLTLQWPWCIANVTPENEVQALNRADTVFAIQEEEASILRARGVSRVETIFPLVPPSSSVKPEDSASEPMTVFYFGSTWEPNVHGIRWFIDEVLPRVRELVPEATLKVAGRVSDSVPDSEGVEKLGFVDDLEGEACCAALVIVPVFYGTGLNVKLMDALSWGCPVVATPYAFRGLPPMESSVGAFTESPEKFAEQVVAVLGSPELRKDLSQQSFEYAKRIYHGSLDALHQCLNAV